MFMRYEYLSQHPRVFRTMTGLTIAEFNDLLNELAPSFEASEAKRLARPDRTRAPGAGHPWALDYRDGLLLNLVWLRQYPTGVVLGYFFGIGEASVRRTLARFRPVLEAFGRATFRWPNQKRGRKLPEILEDCPEVAIVIDSFEQQIQRPQDKEQARSHYSGKKKQITRKAQVCVDRDGYICHVSESVPGPRADIALLKESGVLDDLPNGVGAWGDSAYQGMKDLHPAGLAAHPRRKPRSEEDKAYNKALAQRRIVVEHSIGHLRHFQALQQRFRHDLDNHTAVVIAVAGVVNRRYSWRGIA